MVRLNVPVPKRTCEKHSTEKQQESVESLSSSSSLQIKMQIGWCTAEICSKRSNVSSKVPSSKRTYVRPKLKVIGHLVNRLTVVENIF